MFARFLNTNFVTAAYRVPTSMRWRCIDPAVIRHNSWAFRSCNLRRLQELTRAMHALEMEELPMDTSQSSPKAEAKTIHDDYERMLAHNGTAYEDLDYILFLSDLNRVPAAQRNAMLKSLQKMKGVSKEEEAYVSSQFGDAETLLGKPGTATGQDIPSLGPTIPLRDFLNSYEGWDSKKP
jgi:hypothetical protein